MRLLTATMMMALAAPVAMAQQPVTTPDTLASDPAIQVYQAWRQAAQYLSTANAQIAGLNTKVKDGEDQIANLNTQLMDITKELAALKAMQPTPVPAKTVTPPVVEAPKP